MKAIDCGFSYLLPLRRRRRRGGGPVGQQLFWLHQDNQGLGQARVISHGNPGDFQV
jgi:hypothetical protein